MFVFGASLVNSYVYLSVPTLLHASDVMASVKILTPGIPFNHFLFVLLVIKKKTQMHACFMFLLNPKSLTILNGDCAHHSMCSLSNQVALSDLFCRTTGCTNI